MHIHIRVQMRLQFVSMYIRIRVQNNPRSETFASIQVHLFGIRMHKSSRLRTSILRMRILYEIYSNIFNLFGHLKVLKYTLRFFACAMHTSIRNLFGYIKGLEYTFRFFACALRATCIRILLRPQSMHPNSCKNRVLEYFEFE